MKDKTWQEERKRAWKKVRKRKRGPAKVEEENKRSNKKREVYKMKSVGKRETCIKYTFSISAGTERRVFYNDSNNSHNC